MPALKPTHYTAEIVWLGSVMDSDRDALSSPARDTLDLTFAGVEGAFHAGMTRPSCSRVKSQYVKGTAIKNERQLSIVSQEELDAIAAEMGIDTIDPTRVGATMVIKGIPDFTHVPPSSRLQACSGATVTIDMENRPCVFPSKSLEKVHPGQGVGFKPAAKDRRGVCAWVAAEGVMSVGDTLTLHIPINFRGHLINVTCFPSETIGRVRGDSDSENVVIACRTGSLPWLGCAKAN